MKGDKGKTAFLASVGFLWSVDRLHPWLILGSLFNALGTALQSLVTPLIVAQIINVLLSRDVQTWQLLAYGVAFLCCNLIGAYLACIGIHCTGQVRRLALPVLCHQYLAALLKHGIDFFHSWKVTKLTSIGDNLVSAHSSLLDKCFSDLLNILVRFVLVVIVTWYIISPVISLVMAALGAGLMLLRIGLSKERRSIVKHSNEAAVSIVGQMGDSLANVSVVKSYAQEQGELERLDKKSEMYLDIRGKVVNTFFVRNLISNTANWLLKVVVLALGVEGVVQGRISIAMLIVIQSYLGSMTSALSNFGQVVEDIQDSLSKVHTAVELIDLKPEVPEPVLPASVTPEDFHQAIHLHRVGFAYNGGAKKVFSELELCIPAGEQWGIVGLSGAGKTTLASLITRLFDVQAGSIRIGEHDIRTIAQQTLHRHIGYVMQDGSLFHRSIRENIAFGRPDAGTGEIVEAACRAQIHDVIMGLPGGYDTVVGERGFKLSGGERQRIAIARAMVADPSIIILDEATSSLDSISEMLVQEALEELMRGRTAIVIAIG